jgi:polysaccharide deacetylase 2 family uncharacterized protein YibQ
VRSALSPYAVMPGSVVSSSPLRTPLLAGLGAAVLMAAAAGGLAWLTGAEPTPVSASVAIERPEPVALAEAPAPTPEDPFADAPVDDVSLPGVTDTQAALAEPPVAPVRASQGPQAPLPGLFEAGPGGAPVPVIAADGTRPDAAYAADFEPAPGAPTIALVVGGLGLSERLTARAIEVLPAEVTLSFAPYSDDLQGWIDRARADGHEVLIELPMEPFDYPNNDPGPHTLLAEAGASENDRRLLWLLSRASGYAGVANYLGARLGAERESLSHIFSQLESRGLSVFHDGTGRRAVLEAAARQAQARVAIADRVIDADPHPEAVDRRLLELEALALQNGDALGHGFAYPATVDTVAAWAEALSARGYELAPASVLMANRQGRDEPET